MSGVMKSKHTLLLLVTSALVGLLIVPRLHPKGYEKKKIGLLKVSPKVYDQSSKVDHTDHRDHAAANLNDVRNQNYASEAAGQEMKGRCSRNEDVIKHFVMSKVEKTGTSTLFLVFGRFILMKKLNVLQGYKTLHINWEHRASWRIGPKNAKRADAMICHASYNESIFNQYFIKSYKYIVPVRDPVGWFQSAVSYFGIAKKLKNPDIDNVAETVIMDDKWIYRKRHMGQIKSLLHLPQLQWLGFDYDNLKTNITAIKEYIRWFIPKIDVPILNNQFDASLIVLKKKFCWSYLDIFYTSQNKGKHKRKDLSAEATKRLLSPEVNFGDQLLYESINKTWWRQSEVNQRYFWDKVSYFSALNRNVSQICARSVIPKDVEVTISSTRWHTELFLTTDYCRYLVMNIAQMRKTIISYNQGHFNP